jgi:hypothetical protein
MCEPWTQEEGERPQMGNLLFADTRWTGFRDPEQLQETYAAMAVLDGRMAGYYDSVMFELAGTSSPRRWEGLRM